MLQADVDVADPVDPRVQGVLDRLHATVKPLLHAADRALTDGDRAAVARHLDDALGSLCGILRDGHGGRERPSTLDEAVDRAIAEARRRTGGRVRVQRPGHQPLPDVGGDAVGLVFDTVEEAVHNAARHRPGACVAVAVVDEAGQLRLTVATRGGDPVAPSPPGTGLARLRARARRAGGSLQAVDTPEGHLLELRLPAGGG